MIQCEKVGISKVNNGFILRYEYSAKDFDISETHVFQALSGVIEFIKEHFSNGMKRPTPEEGVSDEGNGGSQ